MAMHPQCNHEYNQSYPVISNPVYVTRITGRLGHTKTLKVEYCNVVPLCCVVVIASLENILEYMDVCRIVSEHFRIHGCM